MIPQLALKPGMTPLAGFSHTHLTEEQFGELMLMPANAAAVSAELAENHLRCCEQCAAQLASLRESLSSFRDASTAHANNELRRMPQVSLPSRRPLFEPAYLAAAAAAIFLAALLPTQMLRQRAPHPVPAVAAQVAAAPAESDEALLEDINRDVSASVPAPMQALADPTAISPSTSTGVEPLVQNSTPRKD